MDGMSPLLWGRWKRADQKTATKTATRSGEAAAGDGSGSGADGALGDGSGARRTDRGTGAAGGRRPEDRLVTLIGKPGCHLCDDARAVVEKVCAEVGCSWEERHITEDEELYRTYWEQIPVVLVDGAQHDFWRVDEGRLRRALTA